MNHYRLFWVCISTDSKGELCPHPLSYSLSPNNLIPCNPAFEQELCQVASKLYLISFSNGIWTLFTWSFSLNFLKSKWPQSFVFSWTGPYVAQESPYTFQWSLLRCRLEQELGCWFWWWVNFHIWNLEFLSRCYKSVTMKVLVKMFFLKWNL